MIARMLNIRDFYLSIQFNYELNKQLRRLIENVQRERLEWPTNTIENEEKNQVVALLA